MERLLLAGATAAFLRLRGRLRLDRGATTLARPPQFYRSRRVRLDLWYLGEATGQALQQLRVERVRGRGQAVVAPQAVLAHFDQAHPAQISQVSRRGRL